MPQGGRLTRRQLITWPLAIGVACVGANDATIAKIDHTSTQRLEFLMQALVGIDDRDVKLSTAVEPAMLPWLRPLLAYVDHHVAPTRVADLQAFLAALDQQRLPPPAATIAFLIRQLRTIALKAYYFQPASWTQVDYEGPQLRPLDERAA